ncbi:MAG: hypothetical protein P8Y65_06945 [Campylobacterales bacterium]|jgi:hypothetical protein
MFKRAIAALLLLWAALASAFSINVIVPYEDDTEKPEKKEQLTGEQKRQKALFEERLKRRDAERLEAKKAQEELIRQREVQKRQEKTERRE